MKTGVALANRLREVILEGRWIANTNFKHQLSGMSWQTATARLGSMNTIAALAQHIHYYLHGVLQVFKGGALDIKDQFSFYFPAITSQQQWDDFLTRFWNDAEDMAALIEQMPDEQLQSIFVDEKYGTTLRNIDGLIEHSYYHLGQVVLTRKFVERKQG